MENEEEKNSINDNNIQEEEGQFIDCSKLGVPKLLELAEENFDKLNIEDAEYFYEEAFEKEPKNEKLLASYTEFLIYQKENEKAAQLLELALKVYPNTIYYKMFFQLAQLTSGQQAIELYQRGIQNINKQYLIQNNIYTEREIQKDLSESYAAIAEIYQTDFLKHKESEQEVMKHIQKSFEVDPNCSDAFMQLTNYFLNKEILDKAKEPLQKLVQNLENIEPEEDNHTEPFKIQTIKLCIEVEEFEWPLQILENLILEDKDNFEAYYLTGFCQYKLNNLFQSFDIIKNLMLRKTEFQEDEELYTAVLEIQEYLYKANYQTSNDTEQDVFTIDKDQDNNNNNNTNQSQQQQEECIENEDEEWMDLEEDD